MSTLNAQPLVHGDLFTDAGAGAPGKPPDAVGQHYATTGDLSKIFR